MLVVIYVAKLYFISPLRPLSPTSNPIPPFPRLPLSFQTLHDTKPTNVITPQYTRLTSTRLHKFYTLTLLLTLPPLIILHLVALSSTSTALNRLSLLLLATTNSTNDNSVVPTVTDQNGQGILRLCNVGESDCQTVTSVASTATATTPVVVVTSTSTPQQVASPFVTVPVNAGAPTASAVPAPDVAVQPGGARPASSASPTSSQSASSPPPPPPPSPASPSSSAATTSSDDGVLVAAPPAQTQTQTQTSSSSSSSTSTGLFIADALSTTSTTNGQGKGQGDGNGNGNGNSGGSTSSEIPSATRTSSAKGENSGSNTISAETDTKSIVVSSSSSEASTSATTTTTPATTPATITITTSSSTQGSSTSTPTSPHSRETDITSSPVVGNDVSVNDVTLPSSKASGTTTLVVPSSVRPEFGSVSESGESSASVVPSTVEPTNAEPAITSPPTSTSSTSSSSSSSSGEEANDTQEVTTDKNKQESAASSRTKESSAPITTPTSTSSKSESTESSEVPVQTSSTRVNGDINSTSPSNAHFFSSRRLSIRAFSATPITNSTTGALVGIDVTDVDDTGGTGVTRLGVVCAIAMAFPRDQLQQGWVENLTMAAFYLGMLGVGIAAILNESVVHLITISLSTLLSLLWTGTQLVRTHYAHDQFDAFITRGACSGIDVLPSYWAQRTRLELPILIINTLALLFLGVLGFQLFKRYHREGGGGRGVERYLYKIVVVLRCAVLLGGFLLAAGMGIWVHLLFTNAGVLGASGLVLLKALGVVSLVFVTPWGVLGWLALNSATPSTSGAYNGGDGKWGRWWGRRTMMGFFCGLNVLFLGGWIATFASDVYRAVFLAWTFFAVLSIAGFFVLMGSLGAGVVCWMRFARDSQDFDSEKPPSDVMSRPFSIASLDPFGVRPSIHSHSDHSHSHSHVHDDVGAGLSGGGGGPESLRWGYSNTAEKAWEPFDEASIRQSHLTASEGRQSTVFSYGLRSPAPPMPTRPEYGSSNNSNVTLGLAL